MPQYTDQTGRQVSVKERPLRIVSLVPSQTELLHSLGLEKEVVGITAYCVHPKAWLSQKTIIGGTKNLQINAIKALQPDIILGNKEENIKEQIESLANDFPVWLSDIHTVDDALKMISQIGAICHKKSISEQLVKDIQAAINQLKPLQNTPVLYFIWKDPYMLAGKQTFINSMLQLCGFTNAAPVQKDRYPQITEKAIAHSDAQVILLSSEPYAFNTKVLHHIGQLNPKALVKIVDGEMFSWYGSRMLHSISYFRYLVEGIRSCSH